MRTYEELAIEFSSHSVEEKQKFIDELSIDELRIFKDGLVRSLIGLSSLGSWVSYIDSVISKKIEKERELKLKDLGL